MKLLLPLSSELVIIFILSAVILLVYIWQRKKTKKINDVRKRKTPKVILKGGHTNQVKTEESKAEQKIDYPKFSSQKTGLTWGGGNVHGANAKRGEKKRFLR
ncbi:hypothetical protein [Namhaeicola litoreus]|uniref:Uncharacterized protein n=1 Tax=Namhaeicola litoreus TaxID=1052145 RepID=A0ABW3Y3J1_9FLAO